MFNLMQVSGRELTEGGIERDGIALGGGMTRVYWRLMLFKR